MRADDVEQILAICQAGLDGGHASFETTVPTREKFNALNLPRRRHVAIDDATTGRLLGRVAATPVSYRCVYAGVIEHTIYVHPKARGRGIGDALLQALIGSTEGAHVWTIQSGIVPENTTNLALHERYGFWMIGPRQHVGKHHAPWRDVVLIERRSPAIV